MPKISEMKGFKKVILLIIIVFITMGALFFPWTKAQPIQYIERQSGQMKVEKVPGEYWLNWLYYHPFGQLSLEIMVKKKFLSEWYGAQMDKSSSTEKIEPFVLEYEIEMEDYVAQDYSSFNEFFYRKLKPGARNINQDSLVLVSPADGKVLAYPHIQEQDFIVKGYRFNLNSYLQNDSLAHVFKDAALYIFRLCPTDYHRYHFPASGEIVQSKNIDGDYYSVSPIALREKVELITMNKRDYSVLRTREFGDVIYSEVAATMVGSMIDTYEDQNVIKGEEKGYFKFGGSTIILILQTDSIQVDADLVQNSQNYFETEIKMGAQIGIKTN